MKYRNNEYCITPDDLSAEAVNARVYSKNCDNDNWYRETKCKNADCDNMCETDNNCGDDIMRKLSELQFAAIDLNLYLDTHPNDEEALKMFKKVTKTIETVKVDYIRKYGPIKACDSSDEVPFEWTSCKFKWPWEK